MNDIKKKLTDIVIKVEPSVVIDEGSFEKVLSEIGIDSLDMMSILLNVQESFDLPEIPDDRINELNTLGKIAMYIDTQK